MKKIGYVVIFDNGNIFPGYEYTSGAKVYTSIRRATAAIKHHSNQNYNIIPVWINLQDIC